MGLQELYRQQDDYDEVFRRVIDLMQEFEEKAKDLTSITHEDRTTTEILEEASFYAGSFERIFAGEKGRTHIFFHILKSLFDEIRQNEEQLKTKSEELVEWTFQEIITLVRSVRGYDEWPKVKRQKYIEELQKLLAEMDNEDEDEDEDPDRSGKVKVRPTLVLRRYHQR
jgi:hypothetical protein